MVTQEGRDNGDKIRMYIGAGTLAVVLTIAGIIFNAGQYVTNIIKIPDLDKRVCILETSSAATGAELKYIHESIDDIKVSLGVPKRSSR